MAEFTGKWKKVGVTNAEEIISKVYPGVPKDKTGELRQFLNDNDQVEEYRVDGDTGYRKLYVGGKLTKDHVNKFNTDLDRESILGSAKLRLTVKSPSRIEGTETAPDRVAQVVLRVEGGKLYQDYIYGGVTCTRTYEKQ